MLNQLRDEFPDITISKIRFLESQGLVDPERTPSGYRKFYPADVERLRFILREQREHFLPLKVIKERLDEVDRDGGFAERSTRRPKPTPSRAPNRAGAKAPVDGRCSRDPPRAPRPPRRARPVRQCATTTAPTTSRSPRAA